MSSAGQDAWIAAQFPKRYAGWGFDIGAANGVESSNTYMLESDGWNILCIEAIYGNAELLRHHRRRSMMCAVDFRPQEWGEFHVNPSNPTAFSSLRPDSHSGYTTTAAIRVPVLTLDQVMYLSGFPRLDLISIDIEGTELQALMGLDIAKWRPKVIMCECWPHNRSASDVGAYLANFGYKDVITLGHDHGFVCEEVEGGGDAGQSGGQAVRDEPQAVARAGGRVPLPEDVGGGVRRPRSRRAKGNVEQAG